MLDDRRSDIIRSIQAGETYKSIGQRWRLSKQRVYAIAKEAGTTSSRPSGKPLAPDRVIQVARLIRRGMPIAHAAETVGVSTSSAWMIAVRECGHEPTQAPPTWQRRETRFVLDHYKQPGWSAQRIADRLGRNRHEVIGRARRLGLSGPA